MSEFQPLPEPFLEPRHRELAARLRSVWTAPIEEVQQAFEATSGGFEDEDRAAREFVRHLAAEGLLEAVLEGDTRSLCLAREELARVSGFADSQLALQGLGSEPIRIGGSDTQREAYLGPAARGEKVAAFALTEPEAGSDVRSMSATAVRDGERYRLSGTKTLITNAGVADFYCVFTRLGDGDEFAAFVLEPGDTGFEVTERLRAMAPHPLGTLRMVDCVVPEDRRIGAEGQGLDLAFGTLERFRPSVGAAASGLARRALEEALGHAGRRRQFGRALGDFQLTRTELAQSWADWEAARLSVLRSAWILDTGGADSAAASSMGKLLATETAQRVIDRAVQLHGGRGVVVGSVVERLYRDIRALRIYEGTSEIQKLILGRRLMSPPST